MVVRRHLLAIALVITALLTGGCWDRKEIENRGYVLGVAIDHASAEPKGRYDLNRAFQQAGTRRYRLSYELPNFKKGGSGEQGGYESIVISAEGGSIIVASRAISTKIALAMFIEDTQVILISEEVAREGIKEVFDGLLRFPGSRRRAAIFVTKGRAEDFIKRKTKSGTVLNSLNYPKFATAVKRVPTIASVSEFGYFSEALRGKHGFSAPVVYMENDEVKAAGAALFNSKGQMVGIADEYETVGGKIWRNKFPQGAIMVAHPDKPETFVVFEVAESKTTVKPDFSGDTVRFIVKGEFSGTIGENKPMEQMAASDEQSQNAIAQALAAELTNHTYAVLTKIQTVHADTFALGDLIRCKNPKYWEKIKDRWEDEIFPTVEADVTIKVIVKGSGMTF